MQLQTNRLWSILVMADFKLKTKSE